MNAELPQSAIDAARAAAFACDQGEDIQYAMLNAAAPKIGTEYLRWAASRARKESKPIATFRRGDGRVDSLIPATLLEQWADELEGTDRLHATNDTERLHEPAGDGIYLAEGTGTYDPDAPASAFKKPDLDQECWIGDA